MKRSHTLDCVLLVLTLGACVSALEDRSQEVDAPPGTRGAVIQGLLDPRATVQSIWVEWSIPSDSFWNGEPRPIDPALVDLRIVGPDSTPVQLAPGAPGQFAAAFLVMPGSVYRLEGTIDATPVSARVRIPDSLHWVTPATDTLRIPRDEFQVTFPYEFTTSGASLFLLLDPEFRPYLLDSTTGIATVFAFEDTIRLTLEAYEPFGAAWTRAGTFERPVTSNIMGAYGFFGGFVQSRPIIVIPQ